MSFVTTAAIEVKAGGRAVRVSSPDRVLWPQVGLTKADLAHYWAQLDEVGLRGYRSRPVHLHRFPKGIGGEGFFQKRIPDRRPDWVRRTHIVGPNGTASDALCPTDVAHLVWGVQMGTIEFHPWPTRSWEPDRPDELRVDLDPSPGTVFADVRRAAAATHELLTDVGLAGWPKTSGKRGIHVLVRIAPRWDFVEVRRAAVALARELERRVPTLVTAAWWKEERGERIFVDFNQNCRDRTVCGAWSPRPTPTATVSAPFCWDDLEHIEPGDLTVSNAVAHIHEHGDPHKMIDDTAGSLEGLLELAKRNEAAGIPDAPWPPTFPKMPGEARRVAPSRRAN
ncbi:non-homologous end-joining DNA ligase [Candidatus Neomicrothrix sp.]|uniref:non-homologous end-joining DNA ligase n=1 Tax=Candidatus Neomicrothrix sp. TaxID=2719034 RepID=UPI003CD0DF3F